VSAASFRWQSAARSEVGNVRKLNEDAFLDLSARGLWVVADGMGGHAAGDIASRMVTDNLRDVAPHDKLSSFVNDVEDRVLDANQRLYTMATQDAEQRIIGCTVVSLLVDHGHCVSLWAGDSRVYRFRDGNFEQMTHDHSEVQELLDRGEINDVSAETHAAQNVVTRAVGGTERLYLDYVLHELKNGDRFLLCSDGLYKELSAADMTEQLRNPSCVDACDGLLNAALGRECADNVTAIVVDFHETSE
jgi:serine/threonine protein phosphatase PrpC